MYVCMYVCLGTVGGNVVGTESLLCSFTPSTKVVYQEKKNPGRLPVADSSPIMSSPSQGFPQLPTLVHSPASLYPHIHYLNESYMVQTALKFWFVGGKQIIVVCLQECF